MLFLLCSLAQALDVPEDSLLNTADSRWRLEPTTEIGLVVPLQNDIQFGQDGTKIDYLTEGGQDNLFLFTRWTMDFRKDERHVLTFLYQPLNLVTTQEADRDFRFNEVNFPKGTPIDLRYGFDYYRGSYAYDVLSDPRQELGFGVSMQLRNAIIDFTSANGEIRDTQRDIGLVPLLKMRGLFELENGSWVGFEMDGSYAPLKYLNGDVSDVVGALLDTSVRSGFHMKNGIDPFVNIRYIGGGAEGTSNEPDPGEDGYVLNWVQFFALNIGFTVR